MDGGPRRGATKAVVARCGVPDPPALVAVEGVGGTGKSGLLGAVVGRRRRDGLPTVRVRGRVGADEPPAATGGPDAGRFDPSGLEPGTLVVVDDGQWLDGPTLSALARLAEVGEARTGSAGGGRALALLFATRPARRHPELAGLLERAARDGELIRLGPLDDDELAAGLADGLGAPPHDGLLVAVAQAAAGSPLLVSCLLRAWQDAGLIRRGQLVGPPDLAVATATGVISGRFGRLSPGGRTALAALGVAGDRMVAEWLAVHRAEAHAELVDWGLALPGGDGLPPLVAEAARRLLEPGERAQGEELAAALDARAGASPERLAERLWRSGSTTPAAAAAYRAAGDRLLTVRPRVAAEWYRRAAAADPEDGAAPLGLLHAALAAGEGRRALQAAERLAGRGQLESALGATAAVYASRGLWSDAALRLGRAAAEGSGRRAWWTAQQALCCLLGGSPEPLPPPAADEVTADAATTLSTRVAAALLASTGAERRHVEAARRLLREVAALAGAVELPPDTAVTPHEVGAALALAAGDVSVARRLLAAAPTIGLRAPAVARLAAWAEVRAGEGQRAGEQPHAGGATDLRRTTGSDGGGLETPVGAPDPSGDLADLADLVGVALEAVTAHRAGDVAGGAVAARRLAATLPSAVVDLTIFDPVCELVVLARRFGPPSLAGDLDARLSEVLDGLSWPPLWTARFRWAALEAAVATRDVTRLAGAAEALALLAEAVPGLSPLAAAAAVWQEVMGGQPDQHRVEQAVAGLQDAGLAWEASQLAGQAAIRIDDAAAAKSLLGRARALRGEAGAAGRDDSDRPLTRAGLSEREVEVARLVLDGLTHRDIGATLYISPKTVEHHVAHIRTKLGVTNRAEFLASLREDLAARVD